jgi:hypothetical protein
MPLTIKEVLETLEDAVALGIDFYADKIHVKGEDLSRVHERILVGDILVAGGTSDLAFYDPATDVLITQKKAPPADDGDRALILHECVHAMIDIIDPKTTITRHMGELAAYLNQTAYSVRSIRQPTEPGRSRGTSSGAISTRPCGRTNWIPHRAMAPKYRMPHSKICVSSSLPCRMSTMEVSARRRKTFQTGCSAIIHSRIRAMAHQCGHPTLPTKLTRTRATII